MLLGPYVFISHVRWEENRYLTLGTKHRITVKWPTDIELIYKYKNKLSESPTCLLIAK